MSLLWYNGVIFVYYQRHEINFPPSLQCAVAVDGRR
jgi:hypothetical protein